MNDCGYNKCNLIWLYRKEKNFCRIHSKETCNKIIRKLEDTKGVLKNVYGKDWSKHWPGKIPKFLRRVKMVEFTGDTSLIIGRFQPLHQGHIKLIRTVLNEGNKVCVGIRDTKKDENNPYTASERLMMIHDEFNEEIRKKILTAVLLPDIKEVVHGRKVGWGVREIRLDEDIEKISATEIRNEKNKS